MKAITLDAFGTPALRDDLPAPMPSAGELLVRVQASSVNPVDNAIAAGMLSGMGVEHEFPVTLGRDYAGAVEQVGGHRGLTVIPSMAAFARAVSEAASA